MKKILASLFVASVTICSASAANAQATTTTSVHSGTVPVLCTTITPTNGSLTKRSDTEISSAGSTGNFKIICNSNHTLSFRISESSNPSIPVAASYTKKFSVLSTDTNYTGITSNGFIENATTPLSFTGLLPTPSTGYDVKVAAQGTVSAGYTLPGSTTPYSITIEGNLTPN
jgi:hypothetical protein